jgi:hypothetical protein
MRQALQVTVMLLCSIGYAVAQGAHPLEELVPVCADRVLVRAVYSGAGMVPVEGERVYLQVCSDGTFGYQTKDARVRTGKLGPDLLQRLKSTLYSDQTSALRPHYDGGMTIDFSIALTIAIWRAEHFQFIKVENIFQEYPTGFRALVESLDLLRPDAGFSYLW